MEMEEEKEEEDEVREKREEAVAQTDGKSLKTKNFVPR